MTADAIGGVWQYALQLAGALHRSGVQTMIAVTGPEPTAEQRRAAARVPGLVVEHRPYALEWMQGCEKDLERTEDWLAALEDSFRPDIVHINGYAAAAAPWQAPVVVVCHSCVRSWWQAVFGCDPPLEWEPYVQRVHAGLAGADLVVAPSQAFLSMMTAIYGPVMESEVIYNGRDATDFGPGRKQEMIVAGGRLWDPAKNMVLLDRVAPALPWPVYLAGASREPTQHRELATINARPLGQLDETAMARCLASAAIFASPARYEPFGLAVLEAALSRCALVLGDIPTLRELWDGVALFVEPGDATDLESGLRRLIEHPDLRLLMGTAAAERAKIYSAQRMAESYLNAYARARRLRTRAPNTAGTAPIADSGSGAPPEPLAASTAEIAS